LAVVQALALIELGEAALSKASVALAQGLSFASPPGEATSEAAPPSLVAAGDSEAPTVVAKLAPPSERHARPAPALAPDDFDPLRAPYCEGLTALIVTEFADTSDSIAVLHDRRGARPRRIGDTIGGKRVAFIGYNPNEVSPAVWLADGEKLCQVALFRSPKNDAGLSGSNEAGERARASTVPESRPGNAAPSAPASKLVAAVTQGIRKVSDTEFDLERSSLDLMLENQHLLMAGVRLIPEHKDGKVVGPRLFGIRPGSVLNALGMKSGDGIESINGFKLSSPEEGLQAYARLRAAKTLSLKVNRAGGPVTLTYRIQ
jgi:general secretion pathway protein C